MIRAIFLDVDGTLISFRTHEIPASARDALVRAHARGIRLFIATGRAANDLAPLEGIPYDGVVSLNGARCVAADGRVVSQHLIPRADFERAMELSSQMGFPLALELERGVFVNRVTPEVERLAHMVAHPVPEQTDLRALFERSECCQMCFYLDTEAERRVMAQLPGLAASRWCPIFADINVAGIDKATGMGIYVRLRITGFGGRGLRRRRQRRGDVVCRGGGDCHGQCLRRGAERRRLRDRYGRRRRHCPGAGAPGYFGRLSLNLSKI